MLIILLVFTQFALADSLYIHHHYDLAYIEYERTFFFYPELQDTPQKRVQYAISLFHSDQYRGIREFHDILQNKPDLAPELKIDIARCYLNSGYAHEASGLFIQAGEKRLLGFTYLLDNRLRSAHDLFVSTGDIEIADKITSYNNSPKKSPKTAAILASICPGSGEIYAGNAALGIRDFLLNLGSGYLIYNALKKKKYVDAVLVFELLFHRFYVGSIHNARKSAQETNEKTRIVWLKELYDDHFQDLDIDY